MAPAALFLLVVFTVVRAEILTPRYFNLALGKKVTATATCGDEGSEMYCKLVGANLDHDEHVHKGQVCDTCDANNEQKKHPPDYAVDGMETWWQSPPLSRGMKYNEVNLTIDLGQEFHVAYVFVQMGNSPRPGLWALEKSTDYGKTFKPWQYFSANTQDCERYFGKESLQPITRDDSVICSTEYSNIVPLEDGEIPISLLTSRPSTHNYFNSSVLQEWTRATNVRLRLLRTKNLYGHLMSVARQDPTVTRRYFYSIKDISIGGRCMCNGHAEHCDPSPQDETNILICRCQHNTCGNQCAQCCPGFEQKKWRISQNWNRFECEPCNCHNHTTKCSYDASVDEKRLSLDIHGRYEGGGVCQDCQHNTMGINCNKCQPKFYRPFDKNWHEIDVCQPCDCEKEYSTGNCAEGTGRCECRKEFKPPNCDSCAYGYFGYPRCKPCICNLNGTDGSHCTPIDGKCPCKYNYDGKSCEICRDGYYSPECKDCECNMVGAVSSVCDKVSGNCTCKSKYAGRTCNQCEAGYFNYPTCQPCNCDTSGTQASICDDVNGQCICKNGFGGSRCDQCIPGYYMEVRGRERACVPCGCTPSGSTSTSCSADGKCNCLTNFGGKQCDKCSPGHFKYPACDACNCDSSGSLGSTCDDNGICHCRPNFDGVQCDRCKEQFYNYPACEECNCDPRGVIASFAGCGSVPAGELCQCKERVQGRICNDCKPLFWNLKEYNPHGCDECDCYLAGTLGGLGACNTKTGQCLCKMNAGDRRCDSCRDGYYRLNNNNMFGCTECDCDVGGSIDNICDKNTGQCRCQSRVEGRRCDQPIREHYFPTLHQFRYEVEEGLTPSGPVRYRSSDEAFPGYSWKGYVPFSLLQNEVINIVHVSKSSIYRMVLKYANRLPDPVTATIIATPDNLLESHQQFTVHLRPTVDPQLVTVTVADGKKDIAFFLMDPGHWRITIKTIKEIMIDYFVLVPEPFYDPTVLTKLVDRPCAVGETTFCRQFAYPALSGRPFADYTTLVTDAQAFLTDEEQLNVLNGGNSDAPRIPLLNEQQSQLQYNMKIDPPGPYVLIVEYATPINRSIEGPVLETNYTAQSTTGGFLTARFQSGDGPEATGILKLSDCPFTTPCRQAVVVAAFAKVFVVDVKDANNVVYLDGEPDTNAGIKSITAIPESKWHVDYITPRPYCLMRAGRCEPALFSGGPGALAGSVNAALAGSKKVEVESGTGGDRDTRPSILDNSTAVVHLSPTSEPIKLEAKVAPEDYMFVLHYYQPDHPESTLEATLVTDGQQIYKFSVPVEHCPSNSGCRVLLTTADRISRFMVNDNFTLSIQGDSSNGVWLDYVLAIVSTNFAESVLKQANTLDYKREFIDKCAGNHYDVATNETGFCQQAVFSITTEYNSGTLRCFCDVSGSTDLECEPFGGQCKCHPNVIGRTCSACRTGYYGRVPDCKPCHCPTSVCDDEGTCICPKNVEGEKCDKCKPYTFNFDELRGCDDCNCNSSGVLNYKMQCNAYNGSCDCKPNVVGRMCDSCVAGHYDFPSCTKCSCEVAGTTDLICDQDTAQCYCKRHAEGYACDKCKEGFFNLQPNNTDGCTKCYCFGKTTRCESSDLLWENIIGMRGWYLANVEIDRAMNAISIFPHEVPPSHIETSVIGADLGGDDGELKTVYFGAPNYFLHKRLTSYGGYLNYSIFYTTRSDGHAVYQPNVILGGSNGFLVHYSDEQPPALQKWTNAVRMTEADFTNLDGTAVTRDQFMNVLLNVTSIYIRATYDTAAVTTRLMTVSLDVGIKLAEGSGYLDMKDNRRASSVEQCQCPSSYRGSSCEECAVGHYRLSSGPHAGYCLPCQCNGHTNECDVKTGICLNCQDNTMGDHCEQCIPGYHGDASQGTPRDCLICACPMPTATNNFAVSCDLSDNGSLISCDCKLGYGGARCDYCTAGYYGEPEVIGDYCKPCNCSGNINPEDPGSCDSHNGDCLKCENNTAGSACNLCAPGFFGDAIFSKNCTACNCDEFGMEQCDPSTGICECRPGVIGEKCDRCKLDHYGLNSGRGCSPCDCGLASNSTQCDDNTGQCRCAKGVTGLQCDHCAAGYWNYTRDGCDHCNCTQGYSVGFGCSATGQCECLPGVIGEKCDRCPHRWVLIPNQRCIPCDSCTDALVISVEDMSRLLSNATQDFKDKADSFFTTQRLNYIRNETTQLQPRVRQLRNVDDAEATAKVNALENSAKNKLRSAEFATTDGDKQITRAFILAKDAAETLVAIQEHSQKANEVVRHVADLATGLELSQQPRVNSALAEASQIKNDIAEKDLTQKKQSAENALRNATNQIERMNVFVAPVNLQAEKFEKSLNETADLKKKLEEMAKFIQLAQQTASQAEQLNARNRKSKFGNKVESVTQLNAAAMKDLIDAAMDISNATLHNSLAGNTVQNSSKALEDSKLANSNIEEMLKNIKNSEPELRAKATSAQDHASALRNRADNLRALADREHNNTRTQHAFLAASAYSSIVAEIGDAKFAAHTADEQLNQAKDKTSTIKNRVDRDLSRSQQLFNNATEARDAVSSRLGPELARAERGLNDAKTQLAQTDVDYNTIRVSVPEKRDFPLEDEVEKAERVNSAVKKTKEALEQITDELAERKLYAQSLPKLADEAQKMTANVESLASDIVEKIPEMKTRYRKMEIKQIDFKTRQQKADEKLKSLKDLVEQARTVVNRIPVGVTFDSHSTLQPRLPDTVDEMSTSTHVSAYFRTQQKDGFILYLGNPKDTNLRRTKSDDYMVLGVQHGYPYLVIDIGDSGESSQQPARIGSEKYVADNKWYQVIVDRIGRNVKLSIRESLDHGTDNVHTKEAVLPGTHTIFNLDREKSRLYVGGAPSDAKLQGIDFLAFEGQIEELMIGDTPVGLWNFVDAKNLNGSRQRELIAAATGPSVYRFNGRGYLTMVDRSLNTDDRNQITLYFRTYANDGLLYLVGEGSYFFSVQMQDGKVYLQVSLGNTDDLVILGTTKAYNDGKWHKLDARRIKNVCQLGVDGENLSAVSPSDTPYITQMDSMNFGGLNKGIIQVTSKGFHGCLRHIAIQGNVVDLTGNNTNTESIGVTNGCQFASLVSLSGDNSYLRFANITSENLQLTLKFRTGQPDGLLFVYVSRTQTASTPDQISLSLVKGKLVVMSQRETLDTKFSTYNDSQWHVVTVTHSPQALRIVVDDFEKFSSDTAPDPLHILEGVLFIGGVQPNYVVGGQIGTKALFQGCIADATINERVLNLLDPVSSRGATFGSCGDTTSTGGVAPDGVWESRPGPNTGDVLPTPAVVETVPATTEYAPERPEPAAPDVWQPAVRPPPPAPAPRAPPTPEHGCRLAYDPHYQVGTPEEGYRFGSRNDSHIRYAALPGRQDDTFDVTVSFRTLDQRGGLVLYAEADTDSRQFLAIYMDDGQLHVLFNCGAETGEIVSPSTYNDAIWRSATVVRSAGHAKLSVEHERVGEASVACRDARPLAAPIYYGGLANITYSVSHNLQGYIYQPFMGCLKGLMMNNQYVSEIQERVNSLRCVDNVEDGVYFGPSSDKHSNYLKLQENFKVGYQMSISMEIKPRNCTGLLLAVHGKRDFLVIELLDGEVVANVDNGRGPFHATYKLGNRTELCDGQWHTILVIKARHVVSVAVENHFSQPGVGETTSTDTRSALYVGGHERVISKLRGTKSKRGFTGCIRNINIRESKIDIPLTAAGRNTHIGVCPVD